MPLTDQQRLDRLRVRMTEISLWRERTSVAIDGWTVDGRPIALGGAWPGCDGVFRFAAEAAVPADWPLAETRLKLDLGGESLITLRYGDGASESFGHDPYHREYRLKHASVAIESQSVARLPFGQPVRQPVLAEARLILLDEAVDAFAALLGLVAETVRVLPGHAVVPHLLEVAETALRGLDWPSATGDYVARLAPSPQMQRVWQLPPVKADPAGLAADERAALRVAHAALLADLRALRTRFPPEGAIAATGHAHIDLAWLWPYAETRRKMRRTFHTALALMERSPGFRFNQSTAAYYAQVAEDDPALFGMIRARVASGQWEPIGGMWVEPDTMMPAGESLVRQLLYGQRYFEANFGRRHRVCWLPDCFGFSPVLPQLLRQAGIDSFFTIKVNWSETNRFPFDLFWWEGLDGSRVLAHTFRNPVGGYNGDIVPEALVATWGAFRGKTLADESLLAFGYGDGGGGPTPEMLDRAALLEAMPALPALRQVNVGDWFGALHNDVCAERLPVWFGEMYLELHRGTLTTQGRTKRLHRKAERALVVAETVAGLAALMGAARPESLEAEWRVLLKNEFHDILPGSSIREVYVDAERELAGVLDAATAARDAALARLVERLPKGGLADVLVVVNPELSARPLRLETDAGPIAADVEIAPLSVTVLERAKLAPAAGLSVAKDRLENAHLRVTLGPDGTLASVFDKRAQREVLAGEGNQLFAYVDKPRNWDAWDIEEGYRGRGIPLDRAEAIEVVEAGPHRAAIRVARRFRDSMVVQTLRLSANSARLDIVTDIDWHDRRWLLRALFPLAIRAHEATYECAFGVIRRSTRRNTSWDEARFEVAAHRFVDLSEPGYGVALMNDGKYGHSADENVLGISLLRSPVYPDPLADEGRQTFTYALYPHRGEWHESGVLAEAQDLNQPLLAVPASGLAAGTAQPLAVDGTAVALGTLKPAEEGDGLVLRVYEPAGGRGPLAVRPPTGWRLGAALNLLEDRTGPAPDAIRPFEVVSLAIERG